MYLRQYIFVSWIYYYKNEVPFKFFSFIEKDTGSALEENIVWRKLSFSIILHQHLLYLKEQFILSFLIERAGDVVSPYARYVTFAV